MIDFDALVIGPVLDVFGDDAMWSYQPPSGAPPFDVAGIFNEAFRDIVVIDGAPVASVSPLLGGIRLSLWPVQPEQEGELTRSTGDVYVVREVRLDGVGGAALLLNWTGTV